MSAPWEDYNEAGPWSDYGEDERISPVAAGVNKLTQGATFGWSDEIAAGMDAAVRAPFSDRTFGDIYGENLQEERARLTKSEQQWPKLSFLSEIAGGIGTGALAGRAVANAGGQALARIPGWARLTGAGAGGGAVYGAGASEEGERLQGAGYGAALGGVGAPVAAGGIRVTGAILKKIGQPIIRALQNAPEAQAERIIREAMRRGDISEDFIQDELARLGPDATLADVADSMQRLARGVASMSGRGSTIARETLESRGQRMNQSLLGGNGTPEFKRWFHNFRNSRIDAADPYYAQAAEIPIDMSSPTMQALLKRPSIQATIRGANNVIKEQGGRGGHIEWVQAVKEQLDDEIGSLIRDGRNSAARRLIATKKAFLAEIDGQNPAYAQARQVYAGEAALRDAADEGAGMWRGRTDLEVMEELIEGYTEGEAAAFRSGALRGLIDKIESTPDNINAARRITNSPRVRQMLRMVFPSDEAFEDFLQQTNRVSRFKDTQNRVLGGSPTAEKLSDQGMVNEMAGVASAMRQGNDPIAMTIGLLKSIGFGDVSDETLEAVARILFTPGAQIPRRTMQNISPRIRPQAPSIVKQSEIAGGVNALIQAGQPQGY